MSNKADPVGSGAHSGPQTGLNSAGFDVAPSSLAAVAIPSFWCAGTTSRRHAE
jgi:hypothetical protein